MGGGLQSFDTATLYTSLVIVWHDLRGTPDNNTRRLPPEDTKLLHSSDAEAEKWFISLERTIKLERKVVFRTSLEYRQKKKAVGKNDTRATEDRAFCTTALRARTALEVDRSIATPWNETKALMFAWWYIEIFYDTGRGWRVDRSHEGSPRVRTAETSKTEHLKRTLHAVEQS